MTRRTMRTVMPRPTLPTAWVLTVALRVGLLLAIATLAPLIGDGSPLQAAGSLIGPPELLVSSVPAQTWVKEEGSRVDVNGGGHAYVVRIDQGTLRMYFDEVVGGRRGIVSATSTDDGLTWTREAGIRLDTNPPQEGLLARMSIVPASGGLRMYYEAVDGSFNRRIFSAFSGDGLNWTREGLRLEGVSGTHEESVGDPRVVQLPDGRVRLYYMGARPATGPAREMRIFSAVSVDGLNFARERLRLDVGSPGALDENGVSHFHILGLPDGTLRMYYSAGQGGFEPWGRVFMSAISVDGLTWQREDGIRLEPTPGSLDAAGIVGMFVLELQDGRFRMFYIGDDGAGNIRILSAVASPDSDGDGIPDAHDACPGTPAGQPVNSAGCPVGECFAPPVGLVSWWPADGTANDIEDGNHGTLQNGAMFGPGEVGQAFALDGMDDYVRIGNAVNLKLNSGITLEAWVNPAAPPAPDDIPWSTPYAIVTKWGQSAITDSYGIWLHNPDGTVRLVGGIGVPGVADQAFGMEVLFPRVSGPTLP